MKTREVILQIVEDFYEKLYKNSSELTTELIELTSEWVINQESEDVLDISREEIIVLNQMTIDPGEDRIVSEILKEGRENLIARIQII